MTRDACDSTLRNAGRRTASRTRAAHGDGRGRSPCVDHRTRAVGCRRCGCSQWRILRSENGVRAEAACSSRVRTAAPRWWRSSTAGFGDTVSTQPTVLVCTACTAAPDRLDATVWPTARSPDRSSGSRPVGSSRSYTVHRRRCALPRHVQHRIHRTVPVDAGHSKEGDSIGARRALPSERSRARRTGTPASPTRRVRHRQGPSTAAAGRHLSLAQFSDSLAELEIGDLEGVRVALGDL